ncbi:alanine aminotransferase 2-like [Melanotaenia boesemani]|uniref:alanine aminotransferase 2-like n=1 Tax=Melanotaenia boesemani TaxID=1250792 RepID=UPI001C050DF8|nr:alanine aminotransferase 2-like [Melanotaenia boesemani]
MISLQDVNPRVRAIRVSAQTALQSLSALQKDMAQEAQKPFKEVIDVGSGDSHRTGIKPISFIRQVLAVCLYPQLLEDDSLPLDVRLRAQRLLQACDGESVGSYTASSGLLHVRQNIADFITKRDAGVPSDSNDVFISAGAQRALMVVVKLLSRGEGQTQTGVLTPLPCPHTLPALLDEAGVTAVPYQLTEEQGWAVDLNKLHRVLQSSRGRCEPRAIYISNPGNPTGHVQDRKSIQEVIQLAAAERLLLLVDEVYQDSVYGLNREFISYKKILFEMDKEFRDTVELVSFHSLSCASVGECGLRAGYMEVINMDPEVKHFVDTMLCTDISTPVTGQLALDLMLNPPKRGDPSYDTYTQETRFARATLSLNAQRALEVLNNLPGMSCQSAMGGIYLYPRLHLPAKIRMQAKVQGVEADVLYCQKLLEEEGLLVGVGQQGGEAGPHHLRLCVLVPPDMLEKVMFRLCSFHLRLMNGHRDVDRSLTGEDEKENTEHVFNCGEGKSLSSSGDLMEAI